MKSSPKLYQLYKLYMCISENLELICSVYVYFWKPWIDLFCICVFLKTLNWFVLYMCISENLELICSVYVYFWKPWIDLCCICVFLKTLNWFVLYMCISENLEFICSIYVYFWKPWIDLCCILDIWCPMLRYYCLTVMCTEQQKQLLWIFVFQMITYYPLKSNLFGVLHIF